MPTISAASPEAVELIPLDRRVLSALSLSGYRFLSCRQMVNLFFTAEAVCKPRLEELRARRLVRRLFVPDTVDPMRSEAVYTLTPAGARTLGQQVRSERPFLARTSGRSHLFLRHSVRINDVRLSLEKALAARRASLVYWLSEWQLRALHVKSVPSLSAPALRLLPDACFAIDHDDSRDYFFLELDLGTMPLRAIRDKMLAYIIFFRQGQHQLIYGIAHFRVLMVTSSTSRMDRMRAILRDIGRCPNMFLFAALPRGFGLHPPAPDIVLEPVWRRCNERQAFPLI